MSGKKVALWTAAALLLLAGCAGRDLPGGSAAPETTPPAASAETGVIEPSETAAGEPVVSEVDWSGFFQGLDGCGVVYFPQEQRYLEYQPALCGERASPCSTFKIVSALAGLHTGVLTDEDSAMAYSGTVYPVAAWNGELTLKEAFQSSCVWYFRQVIDQVGAEEMQREVDSLSYGNCDLSAWEGNGSNPLAELNGFWLDSSLEISPREQVQVLARLFEGESIYQEEELAVLREIMLVEDGERQCWGKTGSGGEGTAWFVGFAEENGTRAYFAVHLDDREHQDEVSGAAAREIALAVLRQLVFPEG